MQQREMSGNFQGLSKNLILNGLTFHFYKNIKAINWTEINILMIGHDCMMYRPRCCWRASLIATQNNHDCYLPRCKNPISPFPELHILSKDSSFLIDLNHRG
jgi:hypothetical protein